MILRAKHAALLAAALLLVQQPDAGLAMDSPTSAQKAARAKGIALAAKSAKQALASKKAARKRFKQARDAEQLAYAQGQAAQAAYAALPANATPEERQTALGAWRGANARYASAYQEVQTSHYAMTKAVQQRKLMKHSLVSKKKETMATFIERSRMNGIFAQKGINVPQSPNYSPLRSQTEPTPSPSVLATPPDSAQVPLAGAGSGPRLATTAFRPSAPLNRRPGPGYATAPDGGGSGAQNQRPGPGYATAPDEGTKADNLRSAPGYATVPPNRLPGPGYASVPGNYPVNRLPGAGYGSVDPKLQAAVKIFVPPPEPQY